MPGGAGAQLALRRLDKNIPHIMLPKEERKKEKKRGGVQMMLLFKYSLGSFIWCVCVSSVKSSWKEKTTISVKGVKKIKKLNNRR